VRPEGLGTFKNSPHLQNISLKGYMAEGIFILSVTSRATRGDFGVFSRSMSRKSSANICVSQG
jgi:hypothetical protein